MSSDAEWAEWTAGGVDLVASLAAVWSEGFDEADKTDALLLIHEELRSMMDCWREAFYASTDFEERRQHLDLASAKNFMSVLGLARGIETHLIVAGEVTR